MPRSLPPPSSTENQDGERDPDMHQAKKENQRHFGMNAHIGVDAELGLMHTVIGTDANVNDVTQVEGLLHGEESDEFGDAGYRGWQAIPVTWHFALRPSKHKALLKNPWGKRME